MTKGGIFEDPKKVVKMLVSRRQLSERRACRYCGYHRSSFRYQPRPESAVNKAIRRELHRFAESFRRYGSPRMVALLGGEFEVNHKRIERLYRQEGLQLPGKRPKRKRGLKGVGKGRPAARCRNDVWSLDFIFDRTESGKRLKILTVLDEYTRECLELRVEKRQDSRHVMETLDELMAERGKPRYTCTDNGPEFISKTLNQWLQSEGVEPIQVDPGSPWQNGYVESFHGKLRDECLNEELFWSRGEAQVVMDWYRRVYNNLRPHSALGNKAPAKYAMDLYAHRN